MTFDQLQVTFAHHWLMSMRGGEKTLEAMAGLFPDAPIHAIAGISANLSEGLKKHAIEYSLIQKLPGSPRFFRAYLPFFPTAIGRMSLPASDLLISSDANLIKGVKKPAGSFHLCYCYSPPRYLWMMQDIYLASLPIIYRSFAKRIFSRLREYDFKAAQTPDSFVAISNAVSRRIEEYYQRPTDAVIHPPVDIHECHAHAKRESFYLVVSELTPYKRVDIAVKACSELKKSLVVIGQGGELNRLKKMAGPLVTFMGWQKNHTVRALMARAKAFLFPGEEDFGIAPVEAMASGAPVIAFGRGGILDTVIDGKTGILFSHQSSESMVSAIEKFEKMAGEFSPELLRSHTKQFARSEFQKKLRHFIKNRLNLSD
ncbi:MAG: glycosyltransferase [Verrucomicrobiota bacterium]|nr:glycosyltransferase [Verrucomicrobiota bacterium]